MIGRIRRLASFLWDVELFALYNLLAIVLGGFLGAVLMRPELAAGPVRVGSYLGFALASIALATKYLWIIRANRDGRASVFVVASCYWWLSFAITSFAIAYIVIANGYGFLPIMKESLQQRFIYFFISGASVGAVFKAITFFFLPTDMLRGARVPGWPLTILMRRVRENEASERDNGDG